MHVPPRAALVALILVGVPAVGSSATAKSKQQPAQQTLALQQARDILASVESDPAKRQYRHHWEKAIRAFEQAAKGKDAPGAFLEAAKARHRLSQISGLESDREEALRLAARAEKLGSREAKSFTADLRKDAGDEQSDETPKTPLESSKNAAASPLIQAREDLASVQSDPAKRQYRHNWDKAIVAVEQAARGKEAPAALLEAAKARYALSRFSGQVADREDALRLATRAQKLGSKDAAVFAAEIRHGTAQVVLPDPGDEPKSEERTPAVRPGSPALDKARQLLADVKQDPAKRRYRHHWEKAIRALEKAANGKVAAIALFEAAQARYGLYRFSAVESDREEALRLAKRAQKLGSTEAEPFCAAIRREAGETEDAARPEPPKKQKSELAVKPAQVPAQVPEEEETAEAEPEPELEKVVASLVGEPGASRSETGSGTVQAPAEDRPSEESEPARVSAVKSWSNAEYTRVAIYLSRSVGFDKSEISPLGSMPRRLALDFSPAVLEGGALAQSVQGPQVERVRAAQNNPDTVRVVLDLAGNDAYQIFDLEDPPRLIVDIGIREAERQARGHAAPSVTSDDKRPDSGIDAESRPGPVRRVVIDAGHGGHDSGAVGPTGLQEKNVVLKMARKVAARLEEAGFEVVLTRRDDRYLALEERTAIANTAHGDLFISIHANAHPRRDREGIETYFLNVSDDRYTARLAARENGVLSLGHDPEGDAMRILSDLNAKSSAEYSTRLARVVQREICTGVRSRLGNVRDLGVKSALFYVLLGARMPAVLVETGFISNRAEEKRLRTDRYQEDVAIAIARAVKSYASQEARLAEAL